MTQGQAKSRGWHAYRLKALGYSWRQVASMLRYATGNSANGSVKGWVRRHDPELKWPPALPDDAPTREDVARFLSVPLPEATP